MTASLHDRDILRSLAEQYRDICAKPSQQEKRRLWRLKNSLKPVKPLIYIRACAWQEMPESRLQCEDAFFHPYESFFRQMLFQDTFEDDFIFEPWVTVGALYKCYGWGLEVKRHMPEEARGSWKIDYAIKTLDDALKMQVPRHEIDETATAQNLERVKDVLGDIIPVAVDRGPAYRMWTADLSTDLGHLRGIENIMVDMLDNPDWLKGVLAFMRDGVLKAHDEAERAGDWSLLDHQNQAMPYAMELEDPSADAPGVPRKRLWAFAASQELTCVSPEMHNEFMLQYQIPILKHFGLAAYGCCEDLTRKIDILRQIPNLRRIGVAPLANVARCAEQIKRDYVLSYRPSPADMVSYGFSEERIISIVKRDLESCSDCHVDVTLKDVETVEGDPTRIKRWVRLVRKVIDEIWRE